MKLTRTLITTLTLIAATLLFKGCNTTDGSSGTSLTRKDPTPLYMVKPKYPKHLKSDNIAGRVVIEYVITSEGRTMNHEIKSAPHPELGELALEASRKWLFQPAKLNGEHVAVLVRQTFDFSPNSFKPGPFESIKTDF